MAGFDPERFEGKWFEIKRDKDANFRHNQKCPIANYYSTFNDMAMERQYQNFWGKTKVQGPLAVRERTFLGDGLPHIYHENGQRYHHIILDTDYQNYAVVYGCDQYWGLFKGEYATLLSRTEYVESQYVGKAKNQLNALGYDITENWMDPGKSCGFEAAPTYEDLMISVFEHEPLWMDY